MSNLIYRAWDHRHKTMLSVEQLMDSNIVLLADGRLALFTFISAPKPPTKIFTSSEVSPLLSTLQHDKNGKEVFVGDIILGEYNESYDFGHWLVEFQPAGWTGFRGRCIAMHHKTKGFKNMREGGYCNISLETLGNYEVIGNRYENPELMEHVDA